MEATHDLSTIDGARLDAFEQQARQRALEQAAQTGARVSEIGAMEKRCVQELLQQEGVTTTGAGPQGEGRDAIEQQLRKRADAADAKRMAAVSETPDAVVMDSKGATVGVQHDGSRSIELATRVLDDAGVEGGLAKRVSLHEGAHREQEEGDQALALPPTGNAEIDSYRHGFRRLAFRETHSIKAEGGLQDHTPEYHGYVRFTNAVASELNAAGENGNALVLEAGKTVAGFQKVHGVLVRSVMTKQLRQGRVLEAVDAAQSAQDTMALAA